MIRSFLYHSPVGPIIIETADNRITLVDFRADPGNIPDTSDDVVFIDTCRWLDSYFAGKNPDPGILPIRLQGTPFQLSVWQILRSIPYGQTITYGDIAKQLDRNMSAQAVGGAVGRNPISIVVPCHRVLGAGGKITGYTGGLDKKRFLLELENIPWRKS